ncbi:hypothetical protein [Pseudobacteroides cellulosolvens]|uniref:Lipoprotein n=1 Tax=Pseudobacteroides cellulosolvens ATCC 35603 = DSM 2933 TaxID=398512 RepID=A0A0L6JHX2_9FIRM|nr:hypothetical protein [Pseudobacteroides cellulosolvens]KNY25308.1 hypothetical protein Bccel_0568 [Pseudobacteroides cellulosolvens ATCC 35603 = DSM 2933]
MKVFKKLLAVIACTLMTASLFTACDGSKKEINSPTTQTTVTPKIEVKATPTQNRADIKGEF